MKSPKSIVVTGVIGLLVVAAASYSSQNRSLFEDILNRQMKGVNLEHVSVEQASINAFITAGVPGGVAVVQNCKEPVTHTLTPSASSLRGVLESIVSAEPQYTWEVKEGVINLLPGNGEPAFLRARISRLEISQAKTLNEALTKLLAAPEVRKAQLNLGPRLVQGGIYALRSQESRPKDDKKISASLRRATVREALNAVARAHGSAVWVFRQEQCNQRKLFSIDFVARVF